MTNIFVMGTALYILSSFCLSLALNNTIHSFMWSLSSFILFLVLACFYGSLSTLINFHSCIIWIVHGLVIRTFLLRLSHSFFQSSEILIISRGIFWLRSAPVASASQQLLLTSSLKYAGFKSALTPWLLSHISVISFGSWIWSCMTSHHGGSLCCSDILIPSLMSFSTKIDVLPDSHIVLRVAVWEFRELVFMVAHRGAAIHTFIGLFSLGTQHIMTELYYRIFISMHSGFDGLTEMHITYYCFLGPFLLIIIALLGMDILLTMEIYMPEVSAVLGWAVLFSQSPGTTYVRRRASSRPTNINFHVLSYVFLFGIVQLL